MAHPQRAAGLTRDPRRGLFPTVRTGLPIVLTALTFSLACSEDEPSGNDATTNAAAEASPVDSGAHDDAAAGDAHTADLGSADSGVADTGAADAIASMDADPVDTGPVDTGPPPAFAFYTPAWVDGAMVPYEFTCAVRSWRNPELVWENAPAGTEAFIMIFDDPDAGGFKHWGFFTDRATISGVPDGASATAGLPMGITEVRNNFGDVGYGPNCPGGNLHRYRWRLWAVSTSNLGLDANSSFRALERAAQNNTLGVVEFTGLSDARQ